MMQLQMKQAANETERLINELSIKEDARRQAEENRNETRNYYEAGLVSLSEYLEAQSVWQNACSAVTETKASLRNAWLQYRQACGREIR